MFEAKGALIIGIAGQDSSYSTELLLAKSYAGHGVVSRTSNLLCSSIEYFCADEPLCGHRLSLHNGDSTGGITLRRIFAKVQPAEVYYVAGQSHVTATMAECRRFPGPLRAMGNNFVRHAVRSKRSLEQPEPGSAQARG